MSALVQEFAPRPAPGARARKNNSAHVLRLGTGNIRLPLPPSPFSLALPFSVMRRLAIIFLTLWACALAPALPLAAAVCEKPATCACCCCNRNACSNRECAALPAAVRTDGLNAEAATLVRVAPARMVLSPDAFFAFGYFTAPILSPTLPRTALDRVAPAECSRVCGALLSAALRIGTPAHA